MESKLAKTEAGISIEHVLKKIADVLGYAFADDGNFVFFASNKDSWTSNVTRMHPAYEVAYEVSCEKLLNEVLSKIQFYDGKENPFYGCKSIEEVLVKCDLLLAEADLHGEAEE